MSPHVKAKLLFNSAVALAVTAVAVGVIHAAAGVARDRQDDIRQVTASELKPGDVLFRRGKDDLITSSVSIAQEALRGESIFTHVGIVTQIRPGGHLYVVEALPEQGVTLTDPSIFLANSQISAKLHTKATEDAAIAATAYLGRAFDNKFDADDHSNLYCTELVKAALEDAGSNLDVQRRELPLVSRSVIMPDDLYSAIRATM